MNKYFFFAYILIQMCALTAFGQLNSAKKQRDADSLVKIVNKYPKKDTVLAAWLCDISAAYQEINNQKSLDYAQQALALSKTLSSKRILGIAYLDVGQALNFLYRYKEATPFKEKAIEIFTALNNKVLVATTLYNMGNDYFRLNEWYISLDYYQRALVMARETRQDLGEISCLIQIGNTYAFLGNYVKAQEAHLQALKVSEKVNHAAMIGTSLSGIASDFYAIEQFPKALEYYMRGLALKLKAGDKKGIATSYINIATTHEVLNNFSEARNYYNKALPMAIETGYHLAHIKALDGLGNVFMKEKNYDDALNNFKEGLRLSRQIKEESFEANDLARIASVLVERGAYDEAEKNLLKSLEIYQRLKEAGGERNAHQDLSSLYERTKRFDKAYESYKSYVAVRDTIANNEVKNQISRKELQYDFDKKESTYLLNQQIASQEIANQKIIAIQQRQLLQLNTQRLELSNKEKTLQRLAFLKKQADLMHIQQLQKAGFEKKQIQSAFAANQRDRKIEEQNEQIAFDRKVKIYLGVSIFLVFLIAFLMFYNQRRTARLNKIISIQKKELEQLGNVKDRIFSIVSHDMRTPVNALISFIQLLENGAVTPEKLYTYAGNLKNQLTHTSNLMENLLNWASSQMQGFVPAIEPVVVREVITEVTDALYPQAINKEITFNITAEEGVMVHSDRNMLSLIIRNLLSNAVKYSYNKGVVSIEVVTTASEVKISVTDKGIGMTAEQVNSFNDPNYIRSEKSTPGTNKEKGTGLGWMLCKSFAGLLDAEISAMRDNGSKFELVLKRNS